MPTNTDALLKCLESEKLIGIVRTSSAESCLWASRILIETGIAILEVPLTVPDATQVMETLCDEYPNAIIGAGTVLEAKDAVRSLAAGAQFLVAPVIVEPLIQLGEDQDILVLPGAMTPTEIYKAWTLGAPAVKFFPAESAGGAAFLSSVRAPLPQIPLVPTGGIQLAHVPGYLQAGALAVGVGAPLIPKQLVESRNAPGLTALAKDFLAARGAAFAS